MAAKATKKKAVDNDKEDIERKKRLEAARLKHAARMERSLALFVYWTSLMSIW